MPPATIPNGGLATIRNPHTGAEVKAAMAAGGFDPVPIDASAGDTLLLDVELVGGSHESRRLKVPATRPPVVVRTEPPPRKRDVPLNASMVVVFSEPIDPGTVGGVRVLHGGAQIGGRATLSADGLLVTFQPDQALESNSDYVISISTAVRDASGQALEQPVQVEFTTGSTAAAAWVGTAQTALLQNPFSGDLRVFDFSATQHSDGGVAGTWSIFYPGPGALIAGRVTCFAVAGNEAWVAGVDTIDTTDPDSVGLDFGWRVVDNGPPENGVPDQISLAYPLASYALGSTQNFCATMPTTARGDTAIVVYGLLRGDIGLGADSVSRPPPPIDSSVSRIAFAAGAYPGAPTGGIRVMAADLSYLYSLTTSGSDWNPAWSPDGRKLAFESDRGHPSDGDVYVINSDGSGLLQLTRDPSNDRAPAWSPNGHQIAFSRDGVVYLMNAADGSGATRLTEGNHPGWSPDGSKIVFSGPGGRIWVMNADGSGATQLTFAPGYDDTPVWSPDSRKIVFQHTPDQPGVGAIYVMNPDGSGVVQLTPNGQMPSWSQDSKMILFEYYGIELMNEDGSGLTKLGNGFGPVWSPVGRVPPPPQAHRSIEIAGGDGQSDSILATLAVPLSVRIMDDNGTPAAGVDVRWIPEGQAGANVQPSVSSRRVATDAQGYSSVRLTLGDAPGVVRVEAVVSDGTVHTAGILFTATATGGGVASVTLSPPSATMLVQSTLQWSATLVDANGTVVTGRPITWASDNPGVAIVDSTGLVSAVAPGTATITATAENHQGSATVNVVRPEDVISWLAGDWVVTPAFSIRRGMGGFRCTGTGSFYFTPEGGGLGGGGGIQVPGPCGVGFHVSPISGFTLASTGFQFSADCTFSGPLPTGAVTTISGGVRCGARSGSWTAVRSGPPTSITVTPMTITVDTGASMALTGRALNANSQVLLGRLLTWSSDNIGVATVSSTGVVTGVSPGTAMISATTAGITGQASVAVVPNGPPAQLAFTVQPPSYAVPGVPISPAIQVEIRDLQGRRVASDTDSVSVALGSNVSIGTLSGPTKVAAVAGIATFATLSIAQPAAGYTLVASGSGLTPATSTPFNVGVNNLEFTVQPSAATAGAMISPAVQVSVRDAQGLVDTAFTGLISLQLGNNPGGGTLSGTTTVAAVGGGATFSDLRIDRSGVGYTLVASYPGLPLVTSNLFNIQ